MVGDLRNALKAVAPMKVIANPESQTAYLALESEQN